MGVLAGFWLVAISAISTSAAEAKKAAEEEEELTIECSEDLAAVQSDLRKRTADPKETPAVKLARGLIPKATEAADLQTAKGACEEVAAIKGAYRLPAYVCIAEASGRLAELGANALQNRTDAYCAYQIAIDLAGRTDGDDKAVLGAAYQGQAESLMAMRKFDQKHSEDYAKLAIAAYEEAIRSEPSAERHFGLGRLYIALRQPEKAESAIRAGAALQKIGPDTALALIALAELKQDNGAKADDVLSILTLAKQAAPESVSVNGAIGLVYVELNKMDDARAAFTTAVTSTVNDEATGTGGRNYRAESYYHLSVLDARDASTPAQWQTVSDNAERAVQAGGSGFRYRRQVCLAHIARGGESIRDGSTGAWCDVQDSAEAQLLRGLYYLRRAQYASKFTLQRPPSESELKWRDYLTKAEGAFSAGTAALGGKATKLDWPELQRAAGPVELADMFAVGAEVVRRANMFCRTDLADTGKAGAMALYERYQVSGCKPKAPWKF
jgi:tetratricopeptide (TPR) repeat protein